jgi:hypothetical protein
LEEGADCGAGAASISLNTVLFGNSFFPALPLRLWPYRSAGHKKGDCMGDTPRPKSAEAAS